MAKAVPSWVWSPQQKVKKIVLGFFVTGLGSALSAVATGFWTPIDSVTTAFAMAGDAVDSSVASAGNALLRAERSVTGVFLDLGASSGLAAPLTTAAIVLGTFGIVFVIVWTFWQVAKVVNPQ